jgi:hypothetical protein
MMPIIKSANLLLAFLLELCMLAAFGYWGLRSGGSTFARIALAIAAPLLAAVVWGIFMAPNSRRRLREPWYLLASLVIFGLAIAALYSAGQHSLASLFGLLFILNKILLYAWKQ